MDKYHMMNASQSIAMFCRLIFNTKKSLPIRASEMGLLILIKESKIKITPLDAAGFFKVSKPMIASMTKQLINKGYLTKKPHEKDKRSVTLHLTDSGLSLVDDALTDYIDTMVLLYEKMGAGDFTQFLKLLDSANKILGENTWEE